MPYHGVDGLAEPLTEAAVTPPTSRQGVKDKQFGSGFESQRTKPGRIGSSIRQRSREECPVSKALNANIKLDAKLVA